MKIKYLGTAAAEGFPALFCACPACRSAEQLGGRDIRTRAGLLVNDDILLDITPDIFLQKLRERIDLSLIRQIFVTHSHTDHFDAAELTRRSTANYCHISSEQPLHVYGNRKVCTLAAEALQLEFGSRQDSSIITAELAPYKSIVAGGITITPMPAVHDSGEPCMLYLLQDDEGSFLLANDTGVLPDTFYTALAEVLGGKPLSAVSMDCTFGTKKAPAMGHMGLHENLAMKASLISHGCADESTVCYVTHFSHNCGLNHDQLSVAFGEHGILAAYDGLTVDLSHRKQ